MRKESGDLPNHACHNDDGNIVWQRAKNAATFAMNFRESPTKPPMQSLQTIGNSGFSES
jgi:hypothetical protein